jgi:hypothetical protein
VIQHGIHLLPGQFESEEFKQKAVSCRYNTSCCHTTYLQYGWIGREGERKKEGERERERERERGGRKGEIGHSWYTKTDKI